MKLTALTYNTLFAGRGGAFLMQEAKNFDAGGGALLHAYEAKIGMQGFLAIAPRTAQNVAIYIRDPPMPLSFEADGANFHHALASLHVSLPDDHHPLMFISAHLCPNGAVIRRREAAYVAVQASPDSLALLAGDFNSAWPHDPNPQGFEVLPAHYRARYLASDFRTADRSVLAHLEAAGWVDIGHALDNTIAPTVPTAGFADTEFATMRCDYEMAMRDLAAYARSYEVIRTPETDMASDHYPVLATFKIPT